MLRILFSLLCVKYIFFWFYQSVGFEGNNKYAKKKVLRQPWNALTLKLSIHHVVQRLCLLCKFISPEATVFLVFRVFWYF